MLQILCLAVAAVSLPSCTAYVEDTGYVTARPGYVYRGPPHSYRGPYYGSTRYYNDRRPVNYHSGRDRYRHQVHRHDHRSSVNARVRANVGLFR